MATSRVVGGQGFDPNNDPRIPSNVGYNVKAHGSGTVYNLTDTAAAINLGTDDPAVTLDKAGTWLILATVQLAAAAATITTQTATIKLRRTNNTAADLTGGSKVIDLPAMTTLTHTLGIYTLAAIYTTSNVDDAITVFANLSAAAGAGQITAEVADIIAVRIAS